MLGALGLIAILIVDWVWLVAIDHEPLASSFLAAVSIVATVGPAKSGEAPYAIVSALGMLLAVVFTAMFTAGIVDRQLGPRLVGLLGDRTIPRKDHVIVVGLGQVGLRLCVELRSLGIPVVGVERDPAASNLRLAPSLRIPTVIGHGTDRGLLASLGSERARAIAAVGSDDLDNVAVAAAAHAVAPRTNVVLRAGEQEAIAETRFLLPLGTTRDVTAICAGFVSAHLVGERPGGVVQYADEIFLRLPGGEIRSWAPRRLVACQHSGFRPGQ
ncbi:MAG: NAD-binding protein [Actinomycetota bacterium]|nr:NAD-binding protein [Actinomycetota bacterium]